MRSVTASNTLNRTVSVTTSLSIALPLRRGRRRDELVDGARDDGAVGELHLIALDAGATRQSERERGFFCH